MYMCTYTESVSGIQYFVTSRLISVVYLGYLALPILIDDLAFATKFIQREHQVYNTCVYFAISPHFGVSIPISFL